MKTNQETIGQFFKEHRLAADMGSVQVAEYLGLSSVEQLLEYESGQRSIPLDDVFSLTNLYNIPPDQVVVLFYNLSHQTIAESNAMNATDNAKDPLKAKIG
jgi:transcriptional regulator with XRE-family HTH domain